MKMMAWKYGSQDCKFCSGLIYDQKGVKIVQWGLWKGFLHSWFRVCFFKDFQTTFFRAIYTCIKKPESFVHSGFSWEVARQLPLNTAKNPNWKTHLRSRIFWNSPGFSGVFCQCKRLLQSRRVLFGFLVTWYVTFSGITRPRPAT